MCSFVPACLENRKFPGLRSFFLERRPTTASNGSGTENSGIKSTCSASPAAQHSIHSNLKPGKPPEMTTSRTRHPSEAQNLSAISGQVTGAAWNTANDTSGVPQRTTWQCQAKLHKGPGQAHTPSEPTAGKDCSSASDARVSGEPRQTDRSMGPAQQDMKQAEADKPVSIKQISRPGGLRPIPDSSVSEQDDSHPPQNSLGSKSMHESGHVWQGGHWRQNYTDSNKSWVAAHCRSWSSNQSGQAKQQKPYPVTPVQFRPPYPAKLFGKDGAAQSISDLPESSCQPFSGQFRSFDCWPEEDGAVAPSPAKRQKLSNNSSINIPATTGDLGPGGSNARAQGGPHVGCRQASGLENYQHTGYPDYTTRQTKPCEEKRTLQSNFHQTDWRPSPGLQESGNRPARIQGQTKQAMASLPKPNQPEQVQFSKARMLDYQTPYQLLPSIHTVLLLSHYLSKEDKLAP